MLVETTQISDVKVIVPRRFCDSRGFFVEIYNQGRLEDHGLRFDFKQDNLSLSDAAGTIRGLHFQRPPFAQNKLVSVLRGAIYDVAVDLRRGSPTYGRSVSVTLTARDGNQLLVPVGFAHGFCTLVPDTLVFYKVTAHYSADHDDGVFWADPALDIPWPVGPAEAVLSDKDRRLPKLADVADCFVYEA